MLGHKAASATQPCRRCKRARWPRQAQRLLEAAYCTLQNVVVDWHLREAAHFAGRMVAFGAAPTVSTPGASRHHCYVVRSTQGNSFQFPCTPPKQLLSGSCAWLWRWSWCSGARLTALLLDGRRAPRFTRIWSRSCTRWCACGRHRTTAGCSLARTFIRSAKTVQTLASLSRGRSRRPTSLRLSARVHCGTTCARR